MNISVRKSDTDLLSDDLHHLLESISTRRKIRQDTFLFQEGMDAEELYLIQSGLVQIGKLTSDGKELTLRMCKKNDIVGELTLFTEDAKYMLSAQILSDGEVLVINKDKLEKELIQNGALTFEFMKWMSTHLRKIQSKIRDLLLNGKKGALYSTLIRLANSYGITRSDGILINIVLTNQDLAKFCAAARESINRMLSDLRKNGVISIEDSGKIVIHQLNYLKREIDCENCPLDICNID
ncbi:Crp/Fnr family transcriptional regulator [Bacillus paralicheniformis]|uniref:Crp/Fnr family transcriptional regulator n=1 Tax=Bacillus TaxID=1386 RepID=UPI0003A139AF|nr:Crp/Fnr family transcriptional regulator [Bacillus paralicheniformis]MSO00897.1 cyclic nucleotide-binding domain-containing protein [Bacillus paralicheniformis]MSO04905.1 cyclic nucleotide-binding domain-containing protein [Bacillus paralicheniformis]MSO08898.1 cyclic nucleotide-binding domain-containing protein [Bacillus paralicheniformis]MSO12892.1 cyclic nucleotide-binding domain-containing protein [Bacillus paralicheniformis]NJE39388.1 Crp/Fnr family transcriptional regulator [Bacillus 